MRFGDNERHVMGLQRTHADMPSNGTDEYSVREPVEPTLEHMPSNSSFGYSVREPVEPTLEHAFQE